METINLIAIGIGIVVTIISYFLKSTIESLKNVINENNHLKTEVELLKQNHNTLKETFKESFKDIMSLLNELKSDIKEISKELGKKKDRDL